MMPRAIIIGGGPAGLTAAYELLTRTDYQPLILELEKDLGGISRTVTYKGNRIDIGGHRFFSKSDRVMDWWLGFLPLQELDDPTQHLTYHTQTRNLESSEKGPDPHTTDPVMLVRHRRSRIYYLRRLFDYPVSLSLSTLRNLGMLRSLRIMASYLRSAAFPLREERNLEQFFINRFGRELYSTFFQSYTEKVWGVSCQEISAEWGAQRIKGLSAGRAALHFLKSLLPARRDLSQKDLETSLIERFLYPKLGPGQMWESVGAEVERLGGEIQRGVRVVRLHHEGPLVNAVEAEPIEGGSTTLHPGDVFFSTMPVKDLLTGLTPGPPPSIRALGDGLVYRDFLTVGLLLRKLALREKNAPSGTLIRDNWIYIQEPEVRLGRMQIFNNWSPWLVANPDTVWLGLEYFCTEDDDLWSLPDDELRALAVKELSRIDIASQEDVLDGVVIRHRKTYPAYFGTYDRFDEIRSYLDAFENLFLVGRNGMHRYNNQDHSMLTAMVAVDNILEGRQDRSNIWAVNTDDDYHEEE